MLILKSQNTPFRADDRGYTYIPKQLKCFVYVIQIYVSKQRNYGLKNQTGHPRNFSKREEQQIVKAVSNEMKSENEVKTEVQLNIS